MSEQTKRRGVLFWILVLVGAAVALLFGSAIVAGIMESNVDDDPEPPLFDGEAAVFLPIRRWDPAWSMSR